MTYVADAYEATRCRNGNLVFSFDAPDDFQPRGELVTAVVNQQGRLILTWGNGTAAQLPGVSKSAKLATWISQAPMIEVFWMADGLLRGSDLVRS